MVCPALPLTVAGGWHDLTPPKGWETPSFSRDDIEVPSALRLPLERPWPPSADPRWLSGLTALILDKKRLLWLLLLWKSLQDDLRSSVTPTNGRCLPRNRIPDTAFNKDDIGISCLEESISRA